MYTTKDHLQYHTIQYHNTRRLHHPKIESLRPTSRQKCHADRYFCSKIYYIKRCTKRCLYIKDLARQKDVQKLTEMQKKNASLYQCLYAAGNAPPIDIMYAVQKDCSTGSAMYRRPRATLQSAKRAEGEEKRRKRAQGKATRLGARPVERSSPHAHRSCLSLTITRTNAHHSK